MLRCLWFLLAGLALGCARHAELTPQSSLDTPDLHYRQGLKALESGDLWAAQASFERAAALDEGYPGAAVGAALVASRQGNFWDARRLLQRAVHEDRTFVDAHLALAEVVVAEGQARGRAVDSWLTEARRALDRASALAPRQGRVAYRRGEIEFSAGEFDAARTALQRAIGLADAPWDGRASTLLARLQTIERVAPGSVLGRRIAAADSVTRAEMAVLLLEELHLDELLAARRRLLGQAPPATVTLDAARLEIEMTWARPFVERLLALGVRGLEPLPDGSFAPEAPLTRAQLAMVAAGVLQALGGTADTQRYVGEASRFVDVDSDHYAYGAIATVVDRGVMAPDPVAGTFRPAASVSGAEALRVLRRLQQALGGGF